MQKRREDQLKGDRALKEIKYKNATVRIHGSVDKEKIEKATEQFARAVIHQRARNQKKKEMKTA